MRIRELFRDDDAVSPVIGVILMVAITVILAAVIATFVLGLGESVSNTTPTASFSSEFNELNSGVDGNLTLTHDGGDSIKASKLYVRGQNGSNGGTAVQNYNLPWIAFTNSTGSNNVYSGTVGYSGSNSTTIEGEEAVAAGDFIRFPTGTDAELRLIFDGQDSDQTSTLARFEGPDA